MEKYYVTFVQKWGYEVEAEDEAEAEYLAFKQFEQTMREPIAHTNYDYVEVSDLDNEWH